MEAVLTHRMNALPRDKDLKGWLRRKGGCLNTWSRRWFVLSDRFLFIFLRDDDRKSQECIALSGQIIVEPPLDPIDPQYGYFDIVTECDRGPPETLSMCAETENDKNIWVRALKRVLYAEKGGALFSQSLEEILYWESKAGRHIPYIVDECVEYLYKYGLDVEGIFRLPGHQTVAKDIIARFERGQKVKFENDGTDVHVVASILKTFLRSLPDSIIPCKLFQTFMNIALRYTSRKDEGSREASVLELKNALKLLPKDNYTILKYICRFLKEVGDHESTNKMSLKSLGTVFSYNIMRHIDKENNQLFLLTADIGQNLVYMMLKYHTQVFLQEYSSKEDLRNSNPGDNLLRMSRIIDVPVILPDIATFSSSDGSEGLDLTTKSSRHNKYMSRELLSTTSDFLSPDGHSKNDFVYSDDVIGDGNVSVHADDVLSKKITSLCFNLTNCVRMDDDTNLAEHFGVGNETNLTEHSQIVDATNKTEHFEVTVTNLEEQIEVADVPHLAEHIKVPDEINLAEHMKVTAETKLPEHFEVTVANLTEHIGVTDVTNLTEHSEVTDVTNLTEHVGVANETNLGEHIEVTDETNLTDHGVTGETNLREHLEVTVANLTEHIRITDVTNLTTEHVSVADETNLGEHIEATDETNLSDYIEVTDVINLTEHAQVTVTDLTEHIKIVGETNLTEHAEVTVTELAELAEVTVTNVTEHVGVISSSSSSSHRQTFSTSSFSPRRSRARMTRNRHLSDRRRPRIMMLDDDGCLPQYMCSYGGINSDDVFIALAIINAPSHNTSSKSAPCSTCASPDSDFLTSEHAVDFSSLCKTEFNAGSSIDDLKNQKAALKEEWSVRRKCHKMQIDALTAQLTSMKEKYEHMIEEVQSKYRSRIKELEKMLSKEMESCAAVMADTIRLEEEINKYQMLYGELA